MEQAINFDINAVKARLVVNMMRYLNATKTQATALVNGCFDGEETIDIQDLKGSPESKKVEDVPEIPENFTLHDGGECPDFPDSICVEYILRCGYRLCNTPERLRWRHYGGGNDIIAYKIVEG